MTELRPYFGRGDLTSSNVLFWVTLFRRIFEQRFRCIIMIDPHQYGGAACLHRAFKHSEYRGISPNIAHARFIQMTVGDVLGEQGYVEAIF